MSRCPYCDTPMEPVYHAGQPVEACPACGGLWIASAAMNALAREHVTELAALDDAWRDRGGAPPLDRPDPVDPKSGEPLEEKTFPFAPSLPLLVSATSGAIFFPDGRLRALHELLSPETLPPDTFVGADREHYVDQEEDEEEPDEPAFRAAWAQTAWPERVPGQPLFARFVSFMPLRWAMVFLLIPGALVSVAQGLHHDLGWGMAWIGLPAIYLIWLAQSFGLTLAVVATMFVLNQRTGMDFAQQFVFMARAVAVMLVLNSAMYLVVPFLGFSLLAIVVANAALRFLVLVFGLELEWGEAAILVFVGGLIGAPVGL